MPRYYSEAMEHADGNEIDKESMRTLFSHALDAYEKHNGGLPDLVFFYRDGVARGQIPEVEELEIATIQKVLKEKAKANDVCIPSLTFILVNKRIITRLFAITDNDHEASNPLPGTVVDSEITELELEQFFLVSQSACQGTVNPTSYSVLVNESQWSLEVIQRLSYKLTHLYFNWPGTIKVPAPCMYAHKLAKLVGSSIKRQVNPSLTDSNLLYYL